MNYYAFSHLVLGLMSTICGIMVFFHDYRSFKNRIFAVYCASLAVWGYFYCAWQMSTDAANALILVRAAMMGCIWSPLLHFHVILAMFHLEGVFMRRLLKTTYVLTAIVTVSNITPLFITGVEQKLFFPFWPMPGPTLHLYVVIFFGVLTAATLHLNNCMKRMIPERQTEIRWIRNTTIIGYLGGSLNLFLWYDIPIPPIFNLAIGFFIAAMTWLLMKFQFLAVRTVLKRLSLILLIYASLLAVFMPAALPLAKLWLHHKNADPVLVILFFSFGAGLALSLGPLIYAYIVRNSYWLREHLSTGLTHELKSPLGTIQNAVEILHDQINAPKQNKKKELEYLKMIERNTQRLSNFVNQLLDLSKIEYGQPRLTKEWIDPANVIRDIIGAYTPTAQAKGIEIILNEMGKKNILADPEKLEQAVSNLLSNAIKFSENGKITIEARHADTHFLFTIQDDGIGIPRNELPRIFERFFQSRKTAQGAGIGLSIAKAWIEAHDGRIWADSAGEGKGTLIGFRLPQH